MEFLKVRHIVNGIVMVKKVALINKYMFEFCLKITVTFVDNIQCVNRVDENIPVI